MAKKCLKNHISFDFLDDSTSTNQRAGKTIEKPLKELPWNQQNFKKVEINISTKKLFSLKKNSVNEKRKMWIGIRLKRPLRLEPRMKFLGKDDTFQKNGMSCFLICRTLLYQRKISLTYSRKCYVRKIIVSVSLQGILTQIGPHHL